MGSITWVVCLIVIQQVLAQCPPRVPEYSKPQENRLWRNTPMYDLIIYGTKPGEELMPLKQYNVAVRSLNPKKSFLKFRLVSESEDEVCGFGHFRQKPYDKYQTWDECPFMVTNRDDNKKPMSKTTIRWTSPECGCVTISAVIISDDETSHIANDDHLTKRFCIQGVKPVNKTPKDDKELPVVKLPPLLVRGEPIIPEKSVNHVVPSKNNVEKEWIGLEDEEPYYDMDEDEDFDYNSYDEGLSEKDSGIEKEDDPYYDDSSYDLSAESDNSFDYTLEETDKDNFSDESIESSPEDEYESEYLDGYDGSNEDMSISDEEFEYDDSHMVGVGEDASDESEDSDSDERSNEMEKALGRGWQWWKRVGGRLGGMYPRKGRHHHNKPGHFHREKIAMVGKTVKKHLDKAKGMIEKIGNGNAGGMWRNIEQGIQAVKGVFKPDMGRLQPHRGHGMRQKVWGMGPVRPGMRPQVPKPMIPGMKPRWAGKHTRPGHRGHHMRPWQGHRHHERSKDWSQRVEHICAKISEESNMGTFKPWGWKAMWHRIEQFWAKVDGDEDTDIEEIARENLEASKKCCAEAGDERMDCFQDLKERRVDMMCEKGLPANSGRWIKPCLNIAIEKCCDFKGEDRYDCFNETKQEWKAKAQKTNTGWHKKFWGKESSDESDEKYSGESESSEASSSESSEDSQTSSSSSSSSSKSSSAKSSSAISASSNEELDSAIDVVMDEIDELEFSEDELTIDDLKEAENDTVDELDESVEVTDSDSDEDDSSEEGKKPWGRRRKHKHHPRHRRRGRAMVLKHYCCRAGFIIAKKSNRTAVCRNRARDFVMKFRRLTGMAKRICFVSFNKCCSKISTPKPTITTVKPTTTTTAMYTTTTEAEDLEEVANEISEIEFSRGEISDDDIEQAERETVAELEADDDIDDEQEEKMQKDKGRPMMRKHKRKHHRRRRGKNIPLLKRKCCRAGRMQARKEKTHETAVCKSDAFGFLKRLKRVGPFAKKICFFSFKKCCSYEPRTTTTTAPTTPKPTATTTDDYSYEDMFDMDDLSEENY
ncbi:unnamed protein product [Owenia fusiformis]|uniref:Uncharacterized protein n=1 Tax=Owenia fusiformis TaxID=6347 RepID=A0A8J1TBQ6_OWEFU|nr:unnamed protein product [Owenia fusiformis]